MGNLKKPKQKTLNPIGRRVLPVFNITLPDELGLPGMIDAISLHVNRALLNGQEAQLAMYRSAACHLQKLIDALPAVEKALANIATNAWLAKSKMVDSDTGATKDEMKRVYRHIEAIFEALKQIGVETIDPAGLPYDSGMALKVITFEQTPGLSKEEVKETIKPSVARQGRLIQMGEVIIGTPQTK